MYWREKAAMQLFPCFFKINCLKIQISAREMEIKMFNLYNKKTKKIVSSIIVVLLVLAMVIPTIASFLY